MTPKEFETFIRDRVLSGVVKAVAKKRTHSNMVILRFTNDRFWRDSNFSVSAVEGRNGPVATISFDLDGSVIAGTGDDGTGGMIVPNIAHLDVAGKYTGTATIVRRRRLEKLDVASEPPSGLTIKKTVLLPKHHTELFEKTVDGIMKDFDEVISDRIELRGNQEL